MIKKDIYEEAEMEVILFNAEDVITTSDPGDYYGIDNDGGDGQEGEIIGGDGNVNDDGSVKFD